MTYTIWSEEEEERFKKLIRKSFGHYWDIEWLSKCPLAETMLADACLLTGDERFPLARGYAVRAMLDWALETLRARATKNAQTKYEVLVKRYYERMSNQVYVEWAGLVKSQSGYDRLRSAIEEISQLLWSELESPTSADLCQQLMIARRYEDCGWQKKIVAKKAKPRQRMQETELERKIRQEKEHKEKTRKAQEEAQREEARSVLRFLAIFPQAVRVTVLSEIDQLAWQPHLASLLEQNLLISNDERSEIAVHAQIRSTLLTKLTVDERNRWNTAAGRVYEQRGLILSALCHFQEAEQFLAAAELLLQHQDEIGGDALPIAALRERLALFQRPTLPPDIWAQLKIFAGRTAEFARDVEEAVGEYEQALTAKSLLIKAEAYYQLACLHEQIDIDVAFAHYTACESLLSPLSEPKRINLLANVYLRRAWLLITQRPDFEQAEENLQQAKPLLNHLNHHTKQTWHRLHSDFHTTFATLYALQKEPNPQQERTHRLRAWQHALEVQEPELKINTAYNLGVAYKRDGNYEDALQYFQKAHTLAKEAHNLRMVALSNKGIGSCYESGFADYRQAVDYYRPAYEYFKQTQNQYWQATTCYDLAEANAALGQSILAKEYFDEGIRLAKELGNERLLAALEQLGKQPYIELSADLSDRQQQGIGYLRQNSQITKRAYLKLADCSPRTATNDLNDLVKKGICIKQGKGRATYYELAPAYQG